MTIRPEFENRVAHYVQYIYDFPTIFFDSIAARYTLKFVKIKIKLFKKTPNPEGKHRQNYYIPKIFTVSVVP